jgi:glycosyltransferase involved in cell wall biosynthesis
MAARPLVSTVVVAYNQEPYIRAAVESALAQTYQPLQVVLSDDCSPDRTFEIMQELATEYRGPHTIVLNRNEPNLGLAGNYNKGFELATGELVVIQDGDDTSVPNRVVVLVDAWLAADKVDMVCSDLTVVNSDGNILREGWGRSVVDPTDWQGVIRRGVCTTMGCAAGYARRLYTKYGPMSSKVLQEDNVIPFWAMLEKGVICIPQRLIHYRVHEGNTFFGKGTPRKTRALGGRSRKWAESDLAIAQEWLKAWDISGHQDEAARRELVQMVAQRQLNFDCYDKGRMKASVMALQAICRGLPVRSAAGVFKRHVLR